MLTRTAALGVLAVVAIGAVSAWKLRGAPAPPERDFQAEYNAIVAQLVGEERSEWRWEQLREHGVFLEGWNKATLEAVTGGEAEWNTVSARYAFMPEDAQRHLLGDVFMSIHETTDTDASDALARAYAEQDPLRMMRESLGEDRLAAPLLDLGHTDIWAPLDPFVADARSSRSSRRARWSSRSGRGPPPARWRPSTPPSGSRSCRSRSPRGSLSGCTSSPSTGSPSVRYLLDAGVLSDRLARSLLATLVRAQRAEAERLRAAALIEEIWSQRTLALLYNGQAEQLAYLTDDPPPRRVWASHLANARATTEWYEQGESLLLAQPGAPDAQTPDHEEDDQLPEPANQIFINLKHVAPMVHRCRATRAETILRLAIHIYTRD
ncbi:MAG: hypothetical protein AAGH64_09230 [Planctomycetota bacterium]